MKFKIIGDNLIITKAMKDKVDKQLSKLDKYVIVKKDKEVRVVVKTYPNDIKKVEINVPTKFSLLRAEVMDTDFYTAINRACDKLIRQVRKVKTKISKKKYAKSFTQFVGETITKIEPERTKWVHLDSQTYDEAIVSLELTGHDFYAYKDTDENTICIVYKRNKGYGKMVLKC